MTVRFRVYESCYSLKGYGATVKFLFLRTESLDTGRLSTSRLEIDEKERKNQDEAVQLPQIRRRRRYRQNVTENDSTWAAE